MCFFSVREVILGISWRLCRFTLPQFCFATCVYQAMAVLWREACLRIGEARADGDQPNLIGYSKGISACEKQGDWKKAWKGWVQPPESAWYMESTPDL